MIFVGQGQMLSVLFFSVAKKKVDQGPRNANEKNQWNSKPSSQ